MFNQNKKYWQIAKRLNTAQLQIDNYDDAYITDSDLFNVDISKRGHNFFLGYYSHSGLKTTIERYGIVQTLQEKGFKAVHFKIDTSDPYKHKLTFFDGKRMLIEVVLKRETLRLDLSSQLQQHDQRLNVLAIEWMAMQNPDQEFTPKHPQLPGQQYPGLGLASKAVELLMIIAWRLKLGGLVNTPQQYHNAFLYSRIFFYINPEHQAILMALARDMKRYPLYKTAWALEWGAIFDTHQDKPVSWFAANQIVPLDTELKRVFNSWDYRRKVRKLSEQYNFKMDEDKYIKIKKIKEDQ